MDTPLIIALFSASVTLIMFAIGRWHDTRVKQTDFLRTKLEEIFTAIETINDNSSIVDIQRPSDLAALRADIGARAGNLIRGMNRPSMLARLYFPDAVPRVDRLGMAVFAHHRVLMDFGHIGDENVANLGHATFDEIADAMTDLKIYLQNEQNALTKKIGHAG